MKRAHLGIILVCVSYITLFFIKDANTLIDKNETSISTEQQVIDWLDKDFNRITMITEWNYKNGSSTKLK